jgi:hypothetical protein
VARVPRRDPAAAIWKMPVTLRNQRGVGCRQSAPDASSSSDCVLAWLLAVSGIVPSREISPDASRSRRLRDAPISCRRKAPTAMRNATHTRSGGVSTARSLSTALTPFSPRSSSSRAAEAAPGCPRPRPACGHARAGDRTRALARGAARPGPAASLAAPRRHAGPLASRPYRDGSTCPARRGGPPPARRTAVL